MKNIHILPTDKPSRLLFDKEEDRLLPLHYEPVFMEHQDLVENQHIYITSNEEIKKDEFYLGDDNHIYNLCTTVNSNGKKIILTTNEELIEEGIQAIDDNFLEWFVKNPSCDWVDLDTFSMGDKILYNVVFPRKEPKQEPHEEDPLLTVKLTENILDFVFKRDPPRGYYDEDSKDFEIASLVDFTDDEQESIEIMQEAKAMGMRQETLEELAKDYYSDDDEMMLRIAFKRGYTDCEERMYSVEEVLEHLNHLNMMKSSVLDTFTDDNEMITMKWFEQFKKK